MREPRAIYESWPFSVVLLAAVIVSAWGATFAALGFLWILAGSFALVFLYNLYFFRDPERRADPDPRTLIAAADGKVVEIKRVAEPHYMKTDTTMVAIFLSVFDVHVQRAPMAGQIELATHFKGKFLDARNPDASLANEHRVIGIRDGDFKMVVRQIAGLIARRIVGWRDVGARVTKGERLGLIRYGSRVEMFLPLDVTVTVRVGQFVKGGETVIGHRN